MLEPCDICAGLVVDNGKRNDDYKHGAADNAKRYADLVSLGEPRVGLGRGSRWRDLDHERRRVLTRLGDEVAVETIVNAFVCAHGHVYLDFADAWKLDVVCARRRSHGAFQTEMEPDSAN